MDGLARIRLQWDEFYEITHHEETDTWTARWKATPDSVPMVAIDILSLSDMIRSDYTDRRSAGGGSYAGLSERMST